MLCPGPDHPGAIVTRTLTAGKGQAPLTAQGHGRVPALIRRNDRTDIGQGLRE